MPSDLLAWLLDPQGWHGLGDAFVAPFIAEILRDARSDSGQPLTHVVVDKEFSTGEGPIDVLVRGRLGETPVVVGIENKIEAPLGRNQLDRHARGLVGQFRPGALVVLVLLTPDEQDVEPPDVEGCEFSQTTYRHLVRHLRAALSARETATGGVGVALARHYLEALRMHIVSEPQPEVDQILRELFQDHREAWREIRRRMPSERDEHHAAQATALCERLGSTLGTPWLFALRRELYVGLCTVRARDGEPLCNRTVGFGYGAPIPACMSG
ncbi:MAG: PD-(D/E)XK nuclease family protein [Dehalococcoidia bacterium]|nr:PD-(D/E)XK nuclease family protein [Dehalococcoidia bacterium]